MLKNWLRSKMLLLISIAAAFLIVIHTPVTSDTILIPSGDESIINPSARLEKLFDLGHFTEGPAVAFDGTVYFSDITFTHESGMQAGHIWKYNPRTEETKIFRSPSGMSNGLKFDAQGRLIAAEGADFGGRRLTRTDLRTGRSEIIAGLYEDEPFNSPNDITIDEKGRIYFSDPRYVGYELINQPVMGVYRIDPDGSIHRIIADAGKPNGVAISPNQETLYVVCHNNGATKPESQLPEGTSVYKGRMALLAYDLSTDGAATFRKVLVDYAPQDGPDGLVVDIEGNLYVAVRDVTRPGIYVYTSEGVERAYIPTPNLPTNVAFGRGEDSQMLYITEGTSLHRIKVNKNGYHLPPALR